jgi:RNA polymerase sigma-70 factor (ECF subfamily)
MEARRLGTETTGSPLQVVATRDERPLLFDRLIQARLEAARRLAGALLRSAPDAEDAVHDAAIRAWEHWSELRDIDRFDAWFDRILVNRCREIVRRQKVRLIEPAQQADASFPDPTGALDQRDALRDALRRLGPDHRIVVVLRFVEDLPLSAIAQRTGVPEGTVRSRLHYALRELRVAYEAAERISGGDR